MANSVLSELLNRLDVDAPDVLDVGGGSGVHAVPLAERGCRLTVVDTSADALATLERRAAEASVADRITAVQGDADSLLDVIAADRFDLVLCHSVLEYVDAPDGTVRTLAAALREGGILSVLVANRAAAVLARALAGHFAQAAHLLAHGRSGASDRLQRRYDLASLEPLLRAAGLVVEHAHGVRVFVDLVPGSAVDSTEELRRLEAEAAALPPYRDFAAQLHVIARREMS